MIALLIASYALGPVDFDDEPESPSLSSPSRPAMPPRCVD